MATCSSCHDNPDVLRRTGFTTDPMVSFRGTFHGLAYAHGVTDVATCVSCHAAHAVVASSDPRSPVSAGRVAETCRGCHPQATQAMLESVTRGGLVSRFAASLGSLKVLFPVAQRRLNVVVVVGLGAFVGFLSGLFGSGGGLLTTPLLILLGIPGAVAAASESARITASATSGTRAHALRTNVDVRLALSIATGGVVGGTLGVQFVHQLRMTGTFEVFVRAAFIAILLVFGLGMVRHSVKALRSGRPHSPQAESVVALLARLPLRVTFPHSGISASALVLFAGGLAAGLLVALLGVAGGSLMLPILIYGLGVPARLAIGTALLNVAVTSANVTIQHSVVNHTVDLLLAAAVFLGTNAGSRLGLLTARRVRRDRARLFLAILAIGVAAALLVGMVRTPAATLLLGALP